MQQSDIKKSSQSLNSPLLILSIVNHHVSQIFPYPLLKSFKKHLEFESVLVNIVEVHHKIARGVQNSFMKCKKYIVVTRNEDVDGDVAP